MSKGHCELEDKIDGAKLCRDIRARGVSGRKLAGMIGVSNVTVSHWFSGRTKMPATAYIWFCKRFDLDPFAYYMDYGWGYEERGN